MTPRLIALATLGAALVTGLAGCGGAGGGGPKLDRPYLEVRRSFPTALTSHGKAPEQVPFYGPPVGTVKKDYKSGDLDLWGWLALPPKAAPEGVPAVVYLHGGFALGPEDFVMCRPFVEAGYAVFLPSLRAENGNPGDFELLYGEVDDARAAVKWLADQPMIDKSRIYTFGHSIGGGISALLSLWDDVPVLATGSAGGLYPYTVFADLGNILPFDRRNPLERQLRLLLGNTADMKRPHFAYVGEGDTLQDVVGPAREEVQRTGAPLTVRVVPGDHFQCLDPAIRAFLKDVQGKKG
jgi:acetyl esterase/lipase